MTNALIQTIARLSGRSSRQHHFWPREVIQPRQHPRAHRVEPRVQVLTTQSTFLNLPLTATPS